LYDGDVDGSSVILCANSVTILTYCDVHRVCCRAYKVIGAGLRGAQRPIFPGLLGIQSDMQTVVAGLMLFSVTKPSSVSH